MRFTFAVGIALAALASGVVAGLAHARQSPEPVAPKSPAPDSSAPRPQLGEYILVERPSSTFVPSVDAPFLTIDEWPRTIEPAVPGTGTYGVIEDIEPPPGSKVLRWSASRAGAPVRAEGQRSVPFEKLLGEDWEENFDPQLESRGALLFRFEFSEPGQPARRDDRAAFYFRYTSARPMREKAEPGTRMLVRIERTWFAFYDPMKKEGEAVPERPIVLFIPGIFGTPEPICNALVNRLRLEGYPVLRMLAHPSRFTQSELYMLSPASFQSGVNEATREIMLRAVECAQSSHDALAHVVERRPELADRKVVGIGFSGGAMVMPAVIALQPDRFSQAVLVGGGADWWLIQDRSNYADWIDALRIAWREPPTEEQERRADEIYLSRNPLDGYHTAALLKDIRTLMIQGNADLAVPSNLGDLLWERAGRPERWLDTHSHESLFLSLPLQFDRLMTWLAQDALEGPGK